jgi:hypothetical protein
MIQGGNGSHWSLDMEPGDAHQPRGTDFVGDGIEVRLLDFRQEMLRNRA